jgi:hypothetical protein
MQTWVSEVLNTWEGVTEDLLESVLIRSVLALAGVSLLVALASAPVILLVRGLR